MVKRIAFAAAVIVATLAPSTRATAPRVMDKERFSGTSASLLTQSFGCPSNTVGLNAQENVTQDNGGKPTTSSRAQFFFQTFNACTGEFVAILADGDAVFSGSVHSSLHVSAQLSGPMYDFSNGTTTFVTGTADVTLDPTESFQRTRSAGSFGAPGMFFRAHEMGTGAEATPSGTITVGGVEYLASSIASGANVSGGVGTTNQGDLTILK